MGVRRAIAMSVNFKLPSKGDGSGKSSSPAFKITPNISGNESGLDSQLVALEPVSTRSKGKKQN